MSIAESTAATQSSSRGTRGGFLGRLGGFGMDLVALGVFLALGVAVLDIIVKGVVLVVGYVRAHTRAEEIALGLLDWEANRHMNDWIGFGLSIVVAIALVFAFRGTIKLRRYLLARLIDASFESFVSKRYLISRQGGALATLITGISVLGVSVGVMALIVVISVMNGFDRTILDRMLGVFGHVEVWTGHPSDQFPEAEAERIVRIAEEVGGVTGASPVVRRETILSAGRGEQARRTGGMILGLDFERDRDVTRISSEESLIIGSNTPGEDEVVLGSELARRLDLRLGDEVLFIGRDTVTARGITYKTIRMRVVGVFSTGLHDVDTIFCYTNLETAQKLYVQEGYVTIVRFALADPYRAREFSRALAAELPPGRTAPYVRPWQEMNQEFFHALQTEKIAMFIILLMIVLVASLNIIGTLVMVVTQKTREIGILKSMGATNQMILRVFLFHGFFIGVVGTSLGTACGLWLCRFVRHDIQKIFELPAAVYGLDRLPVDTDPVTVLMLAGCALAICVLAGVIPAIRASRMDPVEALRYS